MEIYEYTWKWELIPLTTPRIIKKCPRCKKDRFYSSDKFRVNAQQKKIDAWLIYKCIGCDYTYNLPIISRKPILTINKDLFCKLKDNDKESAWIYAFDVNTMHKDILLDWNIEMQAKTQYLKQIENLSSSLKILVQSKYSIRIPINLFLREKLKISRNQVQKLYENNELKLFNRNGDSLKLKSYINKAVIIEISHRVLSLINEEENIQYCITPTRIVDQNV